MLQATRQRFPVLLSPWAVLATGVLLLAADQALRRVGDIGLAEGLLDEPAHLMTGLLILLAFLPGMLGTEFMVGLLGGSVLIDLDHIPQYLGYWGFTQGTERPYTHSLLTLVVLAALALAWRRRRLLLIGADIGVAAHLFRDSSETSHTGVPLLWPWSYHSYTSPHWIYLVVMGVVFVVALARSLAATRAAKRPRPAPAFATSGTPPG